MLDDFLISQERGKIELPSVGDRAHLILADGCRYILTLEVESIVDGKYIGTVSGVFDEATKGKVLSTTAEVSYEGMRLEVTHEYIHETIKRDVLEKNKAI